MEGELGGVTEEVEEILLVDVGDEDLLAAEGVGVEAGIGILFELVEIGEVPLGLVVVIGSEEPDAGLVVGKEEAAEVGLKALDAGADGPEIVVD